MIWRTLIITSILAILIGGGVWIKDGLQIYTKDREEVVTIVKDELFGTTTKKVEYVPAFKFGLLPVDSTVADAPACFGSVLGFSVVVIAFSWYKLRRKS